MSRNFSILGKKANKEDKIPSESYTKYKTHNDCKKKKNEFKKNIDFNILLYNAYKQQQQQIFEKEFRFYK